MRRILMTVALGALAALTLMASPAAAEEQEDLFETTWIGNGPDNGSLLVRAEGSISIDVGGDTQANLETALDLARDGLRSEVSLEFIVLREQMIEFPTVYYEIDLRVFICAVDGPRRECLIRPSMHFEVGPGGNPADDVLAQWEAFDFDEQFSDFVTPAAAATASSSTTTTTTESRSGTRRPLARRRLRSIPQRLAIVLRCHDGSRAW